MSPGALIDYKMLRQITPESTHKAVLDYLKVNGNNITSITIRIY